MPLRRGSRLLSFAIVALLGAVFASPAIARVTTYQGQYQCDDRGTIAPLGGMNVELWERGSPDFLPVEITGHRVDQGFTAADGSFKLTTPDNDDNYFLRMALRDAHGVHLRDFWGINDWSVDSEQKRNNVAVQEYGGMLFSTPGQSHKCAIWNGFHNAYERYRAEIGADLPSHGVELQADAVTAGTPFTPGTSTLWPGGFPVGYSGGGDDSITRHEFGHVIRHGFDGDFGHFLGDVIAFNYAQNHEACMHSNGGYAFNEGWAEFWAEDFSPAPDCGRPGDMETEGDVAAALQELMDNCAGGQRKLMVETLQRNPGTIHSFSEFRDRLGCPIPRLFAVTVVTELAAPPPAPPVDPTLRAAIAHGELLATSKRAAKLRGELKTANLKADNPPVCKKHPCLATLKALTQPAALQFEIDLAKIRMRTVGKTDTAAEQAKLAGLGAKALVDSQQAQLTRDRHKTAQAALADTIDILAAGRPVFKQDGSKQMKTIRKTLTKAAVSFRKAAKKGAKSFPASLTGSPYTPEAPRRVPVASSFPPAKVPIVKLDQRPPSTLSLSCPALVASPKPIEVSGTLTPAQANSEVRVGFQFGAAAPAVEVVKTDAVGEWKASYTPVKTDTGDWTVSAAFGGDSARRASSAAPCQVPYS